MNCLTVEHSRHIQQSILTTELCGTMCICSVIYVYVPALVVEAAYAMSASSGPPLRVYPPFFEGERERGIV